MSAVSHPAKLLQDLLLGICFAGPAAVFCLLHSGVSSCLARLRGLCFRAGIVSSDLVGLCKGGGGMTVFGLDLVHEVL